MRASRLFFRTFRDTPTDVDTVSHSLLLKAGFVHQIAAGIFNYLPLGWRSIQKIRSILNEELTASGAQEVNMPVVQPRDIWEASGRAASFVPPLASFRDRRGRMMVLAPTHEETATLMARTVISSYRDMPVIIYHIQTKFRDETRPRAGLLRVREFEMKDAYSFDVDEEGLNVSFDTMEKAYRRIFERCGTPAIMVEADSGNIGGKQSMEFVLPAESGDDIVFLCNSCGYAANVEKADFRKDTPPDEDLLELEEFDTPGIETIYDLALSEGVPKSKTAKAVFYATPERGVVMVVIRGDYMVNEAKLRNTLGGSELRMAEPDEVLAADLVPGSASPVGLEGRVAIVADDSIVIAPNLLAGANIPGKHLRNVNFPRDFKADIVTDIAEAQEGNGCAKCKGVLNTQRGVEVGHIFKLGSGYSKSLGLSFTAANGRDMHPLMGCYGIGLGRLLAAAIEANHDERGMILPKAIAPFQVGIVGLGLDYEEVSATAESVYRDLTSVGIEVLFDDRREPPGVKFADMDLIGLPIRLVISKRSVAAGKAEFKLRAEKETSFWDLNTVAHKAREILETLP